MAGKYLLIGGGGKLGSELKTQLDCISPKSEELNILSTEQLEEFLSSNEIKAIIHLAAISDQKLARQDKELSYKTNVIGTRNVALAAKKHDIKIFYTSTDYIFVGDVGNYSEEDEAKPVNFYGYSKLLVEKAVTKESKNFLIARTSVVYGDKPASGKTNFALWLIKNLKANKEIRIITDQISSPTLNSNAAEMILDACKKKLNGIFHIAGASRISRYDFAIRLAEKLNLDKNLIKKAQTKDIQWKAPRPRDSSLNILKAQNSLKTKPMNLDEALIRLKEELDIAPRNNN